MKETICCIGRLALKPYIFADTGVEISSYEELCYYMSQHMLCYLYTLPEEDLLVYLRDDLGLDRLYRQLLKLNHPDKDQMKYFAALFREGNYFSEETIRDLLDSYRKLKNTPYDEQCKLLGDLMLSHHRAARAIRYYKEALSKGGDEGGKAGRIYHNLAIAQARLFRFSDARIHFLKAYQKTEEESSLFYYFCMIALKDGVEAALLELQNLGFSDLAIDSFEGRFISFMDSFRSTDLAEDCLRIHFMEEHDRKEEADQRKHQSILRMQGQFRYEMDPGPGLSQARVPAKKA